MEFKTGSIPAAAPWASTSTTTTPRLAAIVIGVSERRWTSDGRKPPPRCPSLGPRRAWRVNVYSSSWGGGCSVAVGASSAATVYREVLTGREASLCVTACPHNRETGKFPECSQHPGDRQREPNSTPTPPVTHNTHVVVRACSAGTRFVRHPSTRRRDVK